MRELFGSEDQFQTQCHQRLFVNMVIAAVYVYNSVRDT